MPITLDEAKEVIDELFLRMDERIYTVDIDIIIAKMVNKSYYYI